MASPSAASAVRESLTSCGDNSSSDRGDALDHASLTARRMRRVWRGLCSTGAAGLLGGAGWLITLPARRSSTDDLYIDADIDLVHCGSARQVIIDDDGGVLLAAPAAEQQALPVTPPKWHQQLTELLDADGLCVAHRAIEVGQKAQPIEWPEELEQKLRSVQVAGRSLLQPDGRPDPSIVCAAAGAAMADVVWVLLARAGLPIPVPSAGAVGAAAGMQAVDSFEKLYCELRPSLVYCQREADRLYAAQLLEAQEQADAARAAPLGELDATVLNAPAEETLLEKMMAQIAAGDDMYAGVAWNHVAGGSQLVVYDRAATLECWREQMWDFIAMEGGRAEIRGKPAGYQGADYQVRVHGVNPDDTLCIERSDGSIEHCAPADEIMVPLEQQSQPVWASVLRSASLAVERLLPESTNALSLQRVLLLVAEPSTEDCSTPPDAHDWLSNRGATTVGVNILLPLDSLGEDRGAAVVAVRASHHAGAALHRMVPSLSVAVPPLEPGVGCELCLIGDALLMDRKLHWQLSSTGKSTEDNKKEPAKMLVFEFVSTKRGTARETSVMDSLVEVALPWCMANGFTL